MEIVREMANASGQRQRLLLKANKFQLQFAIGGRVAQPLFETAEGDRDASKLLADVVV